MRQRALVLIVCTALFIPNLISIRAQSAELGTFGLIAGVSRSTMRGDDVLNQTQHRLGIIVEVSSAKLVQPNLGFEIGALYTDRGYHIPISADDLRFETSYLDVPVLFRLSAETARFVPYTVGGVSLDIRLSCSVSASQESSQSCDELANLSAGKAMRLDLPVVGAAGVRFQLSTMQMSFESRYQLGTKQVIADFDAKKYR